MVKPDDLFGGKPGRKEWLPARPQMEASPEVVKHLPAAQVWRSRLLRGYTWAAIILLPLLAAAAVMLWLNPPQTGGDSTDPAAGLRRAVAENSLAAWLASTPPPLPGGVIQGWDSSAPVVFTPVMVGGRQVNTPPDQTVTREIFNVLDSRGLWWQISVETACQPDKVCQTVGAPSPVLAPQPGKNSDTGMWPGLPPVTNVAAPVQAAIQLWAEAYLGDDPGRLSVVVGDPDPTHTYTPMGGGATQVTATVVAAATPPNIGDGLIVNISLAICWPGAQVAAPWGMDVLVVRAGTPAPQVAAWGPAGTGATLAPYQNATSSGPPPTIQPSIPTPTPTPSS